MFNVYWILGNILVQVEEVIYTLHCRRICSPHLPSYTSLTRAKHNVLVEGYFIT
uniref:Uncharacterized protein n=1 Tax=Anguilla anguilla TaxID=7936 RepID=A0A0E9QB05_ANGAN